MDYKEIIDKLVRELSFRVGVPNIHNKEHQSIMSEILSEWGEYEIKEVIFNHLNEEEPNKNDDRYKSVGYGRYKLKGKEDENDPTYEKDDKGNYVKLAQNDAEGGDENSAEEKEKKDNVDKTLGPNSDYGKKQAALQAKVNGEEEFEYEDDDGDFDYSNTTVKLNKSLESYLSAEDLKIAKNFQRDYDDFEKNPTQEKADKLIKKYELRTNDADTPKIYPGVIANAHRHIFNGNTAAGSPNKTNRRMLDLINQHSSEKVPTASKENLTDPSKPMGEATKPKASQFGKGIKAEDDEGVRDIMKPENNVSFDGMEKAFLQLYGPTDENGKLLVPSNKYTEKYLEQALAGSLDEAIERARELEKTMKISPEIGNALVDYQNEQKAILEKYKGNLPNEEAAKELQDAWGRYTQKIIAVNPKMAKSMIKNQAEIFIYSYELARGEEVYLPAHGSYPASDKLVKTKDKVNGERVTGVSVKVGEDGSVKVMGFPTENQQMLRYHKDKKYRENSSSRPGEKGYAIGLKDEVVDSDLEMDALLSESGMDEIITDKKEYYKLLREYKQFMKDLQDNENYYGKGAMSAEAEKKLKNKKKELVEKIEKLVDMDKLTEKCGEKNAKSLVKTSPGKLLQYINYSAASNTSGGIQGITSHSERIDKDGTVDMATKEFPNDCKKLDFTTYREHETSRNGGLLIGVTHPDSSNGEII